MHLYNYNSIIDILLYPTYRSTTIFQTSPTSSGRVSRTHDEQFTNKVRVKVCHSYLNTLYTILQPYRAARWSATESKESPGVVSLTTEQRPRKKWATRLSPKRPRNRGEPALPVPAKKFIRDPAVINGCVASIKVASVRLGARQRHRWTIRWSPSKNRSDDRSKTWSDSPKAGDDHFELATCYSRSGDSVDSVRIWNLTQAVLETMVTK